MAVGADEHVYVTNQSGGSLSVIGHGAVTARIPLGGAPTGVALSPDGRRAYIADNDGGALIVVDTDTLKSPPRSRWARTREVAVTPDGAQAYVTNAGAGSVSVVDLQSAIVTNTVLVSSHPIGVAVDADGRFAYVTALDATRSTGTLVIDIATGTHVTSGAGAPYGVAVHPTGDHAYITDFRANAVSKIEAGDQPIDGDRLARVGLTLLDAERSRRRETVHHIAVARRVTA